MNKYEEDLARKILDVLYTECVGAGGDGDALWYVRFYRIKDILRLVNEYNSKLEFPWEVELRNDTIHWGTNQEWVLITAKEEVYKTVPSWVQLVLKT